MAWIKSKFGILVITLATINILGLLWIRHDLNARHPRQVRVLQALPTRDVDATDRFTLVFDEPLVDRDALAKPLDRAPFVIEPGIEGRWQWSEPDKLEFMLIKHLAPGNTYTIKPAADMERQIGRTLLGPSQFRFETRRIGLESCEIASADQTHVNLELRFNQPVSPNDVLEHLEIRPAGGGKRIKPTPLTREPEAKIVLRFDRPEPGKLTLSLDKALAGFQASLPLGKDVTRTIEIDETFALMNADVSRPALSPKIDVSLRFSYPIHSDAALPDIAVKPKVADLAVSRSYNRLRLVGSFECGRRYTATVAPGLVSRSGRILTERQRTTFQIPDRSPTVKFPVYRGILTPKGNLDLDLQVVNVAGLQIEATRLHANNLVSFLRRTDIEGTSRQIARKRIKLDLPRNKPTNVALNLREFLDEPLGVYRLNAAATNESWTDDWAVVAVTDLAITAKRERDAVLVWVTSLSEAKPVAAATVTAYTLNNQRLDSAVTGDDGTARIIAPHNHPDGEPFVIAAERDGDLAYLQPDKRPWMIDDVDQTGRPIPATYDVMLYTERGVYRPGDTIHLTGIVRDAFGATPPPFPISIKVKRPDGRRVADMKASAEGNAQGVFHIDYATPADGQMGRYAFSATLPGSDEVLGDAKTRVEAFVPVRMELKAQPAQAAFGPAETPTVGLDARYLFGQPASRLPYQLDAQYRRIAFQSKRLKDFSFAGPQDGERFNAPPVRDALDEHGHATCKLPLPDAKTPGLWRATFDATVTEPGGRSVSAGGTTQINTASRHIGLRLAAGKVVASNTPIEIAWGAVDAADEPSALTAMNFRLVRVEHDVQIQQVDGRPVWKSIERPVSVLNGSANLSQGPDASGLLTLECPVSGEYRLIAEDSETQSAAQLTFFAAANESEYQSLAMNEPQRLEIVLDRDNYVPGQTAEVLVRSPLSGTMWVTLETDQVIDSRLIEMKENTERFQMAVPENLRGGAFVTATVVRPIDPTDKKWLPHRACGMARIRTHHDAHRLDVQLTLPPKTLPGDTVKISLKTDASGQARGPAVAHLWAVDEGILLTTAYKTPDPLHRFLAQREAAIESADVFSDLLPDHRRPASMDRIGAGDADDEEPGVDAMRRSPVAMRRTDPAVVWRTVVPLNPDGEADVEMAMPHLNGEMRLMAVVADGDRYGSAQEPLTLASPLLVEAAWPRFVAPGDRFRVPVKLFNATDKTLDVRLEFDIDGPIELAADGTGVVATVTPDEPYTRWLDVVAAGGIGPVTVRTTAEAESTSPSTVRSEFVVRPITALHQEPEFHRIAAGDLLTIEPPKGFVAGTPRTTISIAPRPSVELLPAIESLIDYPYGCVEQTTSSLWAMLYAPDLLALDADIELRSQLVAGLIRAGIARLWSMQTRSGGIAYWPSGTEPDLWGTAYAARFLLAARDAGHEVDAGFIEEVMMYLKSSSDSASGEDMSDNIRALICRVLAHYDWPQTGWMARLSEQPERLDMAGRAHLADAWLVSGRTDRAVAVLGDAVLDLPTEAAMSDRITSPARQKALLLSVLLDLDPEHVAIPVLAAGLNKARADGMWHSTLENATVIAALTQYQLTATPEAAYRGICRINGTPHVFDNASPLTLELDSLTEPIEITTEGDGEIFVAVQTRGLLEQARCEPYDRRLRVRRVWTDREGRPVDPAALQVGDLIQVEVRLSAPGVGTDAALENVAIVDALPGGLEVENPRLATSVADRKNADERTSDTPDRAEFLDDRVVLFTSADKRESVFRYALRVVSTGSFSLPPIQASCMYDATVASLHGGGHIEVMR